ncbi:MAG: acetyl/propionyl/methylcrotonyl-CoA carboxylase subunit alpha [Proteobacteria bacterium]|nr:acetyl/propionyl/methylcrotonyl-CoA carboxylase subunit alpha [Pseudomonadota bacterium]
MFKKILIANRGEIACRIIKTAKRLGIATVAVYSEADADAKHVDLADQQILIGPPPAAESYLLGAKIIAAARQTGAGAIHPGYGFLSENPGFVKKVEAAGLTFIGPGVKAISAMGDKIASKKLAAKAGVATIPGHLGVIRDAAEALKIAGEIGYPVMIKASAGGGGKGMRIARDAGEVEGGFASAQNEARSSFGDDRLFIEKYIEQPRHIEIQIFADQHGNCIHMNERDCSLQRRHQKIIEEAPAPNFPDSLRQQMGEAAVSAASAIDYVGAGTVEFLLSEDNNFYFMEMNTRLQVEHPVTEMTTGQDLVEWQLRIAVGEHLPLSQDDIGIEGHSLEARIYAEDPLNEFLPASGKIEHLELPGDIRIDNGVVSGNMIGVHYDPMMMKIIAWSGSRKDAIRKLRDALAGLKIAGVKTNRDFLAHLLRSEAFENAKVTTDYLDGGSTFHPASDRDLQDTLAAAAKYLLEKGAEQSPWHSETNFRMNQENSSILVMSIEGNEYSLTTTCTNKVITIKTPFGITTQASSFEPHVFQLGNQLTVFLPERTIVVQLPDTESQHSAESEKNVKAPMSGKLISVLVEAGCEVKAGTPLIVIEAMKMEHTICAPQDGKVVAIYFSVNDLVEEGVELLDFIIEHNVPQDPDHE